jgi:putative ABC transport system permease protein
VTFYIRYLGNLDAITPALRRGTLDVDAKVPIGAIRTMETQLDSAKWPVLAITTLLAIFAVGSLLIAVIGQYAVVAFGVRRRTRDFGVRMALGASSARILGAVLNDGLKLTAVGLLTGFLLSVAAGIGLKGLLYGVSPTDASTYAAVFALLAAASLAACYLPARRATRIEPMQALRQE